VEWLHPYSHFAWIGVAIVALMLAHAVKSTRRDRDAFARPGVLERLLSGSGEANGRFRQISLIVAAAALAVALAGPRFGTSPREVSSRGLDLVIALDLSASMLAEDIAPNRLERARLELLRLVDRLEGDRVALVTFAGDAFLQMPLTTDRSAFRQFLDAASPEQIPTPGTDYGNMLLAAQRAFTDDADGADRSRAILIVSDGENHTADLSTELRRMERVGIAVFAIGIGDDAGARIPMRRAGGVVEYRRDRSGEVVLTRLERESLQRLAAPDHYFEIGISRSTVDQFLPTLNQLQRTSLQTTTYEDYIERYQWPLMLALILLGMEAFAGPRRRRGEST